MLFFLGSFTEFIVFTDEKANKYFPIWHIYAYFYRDTQAVEDFFVFTM